MILGLYLNYIVRKIRSFLSWIRDNKRSATAIFLILIVYPIGEMWRLWESGVFKNYSTCWVRVNPINDKHPHGIYFMEIKWVVKRFGESLCWVLFALATVLAVWKDKVLLLFFSEFLCYTLWDFGLMFYNNKTDFYCYNFTVLAIVDAVLWRLLIYHRAKNPSL